MAKKTRKDDLPSSTKSTPETIEGEAKVLEETPESISEKTSDETPSFQAQEETKTNENATSSFATQSQSANSASVKETEKKQTGTLPPSPSKWMWLLMWVLLAAVAWLGWNSQHSQDTLKDDLNARDEQIGKAQDARVKELSEKLDHDQDEINTRIQALEGRDSSWQAKIQAQITQLQESQTALNIERERFLKLQEGAALIGVFQRIAAAEQALPTNVPWSIRLLKSAQLRLQQQNDAQSQQLLPLVTEDLTRLNEQKEAPNTTQMLKDLEQMASDSAFWPLKRQKNEKNLALTVEKAKENPQTTSVSVNSFGAWLEDSMASLWSALSDFVRVQSISEADILASTAPSWLVYENTRLRFLGLRLALASSNQAIFESELKATLSALTHDFDLEDSDVFNAKKTLEKMQNVHFERVLNLKSSAYLMSVPAEVLP